eukprot:g2037.t1 g2037   contig11:581154-583564(+)
MHLNTIRQYNTMASLKHPLEADDSWNAHIARQKQDDSSASSLRSSSDVAADASIGSTRRRLHHNHHGESSSETTNNNIKDVLENEAHQKDIQHTKLKLKSQLKSREKEERKRRKRYDEVYRNPGIGKESVHGLMIDAGSTGSRMHVYEFEPRILANKNEVEMAVRGEKLSFPGMDSRWTERLRPGLSEFAELEDEEELEEAVANYLQPLIHFAKSVLHTKQNEFSSFPIFLKATAGLRTLSTPKRQRLISTVRKLFANDTYCPFWDEEERVRVISGEEEAVYGYAAVNFLLGNLMENSEGAGEAHGAVQTQGALDMGGASTQISFYQPQGDVMSGLFKLQVGQGKHWNIYAHSHLMFGMNMAEERRKARLVRNSEAKERLVNGVFDPCMPGGGKKMEFKTNIHFGANGLETWNATVDDFASDLIDGVDAGSYHAILVNNKAAGDWDQCKTLARDILNEGQMHASFGEFYAFSNYFRVWQFLQLKPRSSLVELEARGREVCSKSWEELVKYNNANPDRAPDDEELESYCFRAAYVHSILSHGYGFQPDDHITATDVINGQKVTWALGSILYEINTLPWDYIEVHSQHHVDNQLRDELFADWGKDFSWFVTIVILGSVLILLQVLRLHRRKMRNSKEGYEAVFEADSIEIEKLARSCPDLQASHQGYVRK